MGEWEFDLPEKPIAFLPLGSTKHGQPIVRIKINHNLTAEYKVSFESKVMAGGEVTRFPDVEIAQKHTLERIEKRLERLLAEVRAAKEVK